MIKQLDQIALGDIDRMERVGSIKQFRAWYNILPSSMFTKKIKKLVESIYQELDSNDIGEKEDRIHWKIKSLNTINLIEGAYNLCFNSLVNGTELQRIIDLIADNRRKRRKFKYDPTSSLSFAIELLQDYTGIKINQESLSEDLDKVRKKIEFKKDKFHELYADDNKEKTTEEKITILELAGSLSLYVENGFVGLQKMTVPEFIVMKKMSEKKYEQEKKLIEKYNNK